ncbi:uncharacterized protein JCM15063_000523 [Sporobolomyces koalae]|uniref:uncharacterized protein n=1 Tax=Sporobolomyces koalae TaxID=500713 RepID=UPI003177071C
MDQKIVSRHITKRVALEKTILTYRLLSRELSLTVGDSKRYLSTYLEDPTAQERGVSAVYLLSGYLSDAAEVPTRTVKLVNSDQLEAAKELFQPTPSIHVYALTPNPLAEFSQLTTTYLPIEPSSKWKPRPTSEEQYGQILNWNGREMKRSGKKGQATNPKKNVEDGKGKGKAKAKDEPVPSKKKEEPAAAAKGKKATTTIKKPIKKAAAGPSSRPIGQLGGLFSKQFAAQKKAESSSDEEEEEEEQPKKKSSVVPTKRKSTSPVVTRKSAPPAKKVKSPAKKTAKLEEIEIDDDDDWAMDEEAMLEMEREANQKVQGKIEPPAIAKPKQVPRKKKDNETDSERQQRELEEMMFSDHEGDEGMQIDQDQSESNSRTLSRTASASSSTKGSSSKPAAKSGSAPKPQGNLNSFFKK